MNSAADILAWVPIFAIVMARVAAVMLLLPAMGEQIIPVTVRIGFAFSLTILLLPELSAFAQPIAGSVTEFAMLIVSEIATGVWFGWLARLTMLALPIFGQISSYLMGLASVLQPDAELGPQTTALSKVIEVMAPLLILTSGLYKPLLVAIDDLFRLIPPGHMLPAGDGIAHVVAALGQTTQLALQLASPFLLGTIVWHLAIGLMGRLVARIQLYFASTAGQIVGGFIILALTADGIIDAWHEGAAHLITSLPTNY